jgi:hypothetical protein
MSSITPIRHKRERAGRASPGMRPGIRLVLVGLVAGAIVALTLAMVPAARAAAPEGQANWSAAVRR